MAASWAASWRELLAALCHGHARQVAQGRAYHRSGRVTDVRVTTGEVRGRVQGRQATPRVVAVAVAVLDAEQWRRVVDLLAGQLRHSARLLAGLEPEGLAEDLGAQGVALLPRPQDLELTCGCGRGQPCAHAAAVWEAVAEEIAEDPFTLLRLRGRGRERLLAEVAARRGEPAGDAPFLALDGLAVQGWNRARAPLEELHLPGDQAPAGGGPLRLLGNPPGWPGGPDAEDLLGPLVERAAEWARRMDADSARSNE